MSKHTALFALLLACLFVTSGHAQSTSNGEPAVPKNLAPHAAPTQPLPFSHKTHVASGLVCKPATAIRILAH